VHTLTHRNLTFLSVTEIRKELFDTSELIAAYRGKDPFFSGPGGQYNAKVVKVAESLNMSMVLWTVFPKDHEEDDPNVIIKECSPGDGRRGYIVPFRQGADL